MPNNALGDFQTPPELVQMILTRLTTLYPQRWGRILEPTCGVGNFIQGILKNALLVDTGEIIGIELQAAHLKIAENQNKSRFQVRFQHANLFDLNLTNDLRWSNQDPLLVIGNPPWVTNSELGVLESNNHPQRWNIKGLAGLDAMTGASNFDLAEFIWLKLIYELKNEQPTLALLCKTSVARNVIKFSAKKNLPLTSASIWKIDSKKWFNAAVDACLLIVDIGTHRDLTQIPVYDDLMDTQPTSIMGFHGDNFVVDIENYADVKAFEGVFRYEWRQGVKHDAAPVMELRFSQNGHLLNKNGEIVDIEPAYVYPLLKATDVYKYPTGEISKAVIVTTNYIGDDTQRIQQLAPKLWAYLCQNHEVFDKRKSKIYVGKPPFSMFGVGDYSFARYKVAISGLHKTPRFITLGSPMGRPVMLDDTCYFIALKNAPEAALITALLNSTPSQKFLEMVSFTDAKRPFSKKVLQRINLQALFEACDKNQLIYDAAMWYNEISEDKSAFPVDWGVEITQLFESVLEQKTLWG